MKFEHIYISENGLPGNNRCDCIKGECVLTNCTVEDIPQMNIFPTRTIFLNIQ